MVKPDLHIVLPTGQEPTAADRIKHHQAEARRIAADETHAFAAALIALQLRAESIASGGDAYHPGVREAARRIADEAAAHVRTIQVVTGRNLPR